jgi:hypothetical protein
MKETVSSFYFQSFKLSIFRLGHVIFYIVHFILVYGIGSGHSIDPPSHRPRSKLVPTPLSQQKIGKHYSLEVLSSCNVDQEDAEDEIGWEN